MSVDKKSEPSEIARENDQRMVELKSLFEMSKVLNSSLELQTILNNLLLTPMGRMMITKGLVLTFEKEENFVIKIVKGISGDVLNRTIRVYKQIQAPVLVDSLDDTDQECKKIIGKLGIEMLFPLLSTNKTVGLLGLGPKLGNTPFSDSEMEYLSSLTNLAATSIENALMFQKLETVNRRLDKKIQELNTLFDIGKELNSTLDIEKIVNLLSLAVMGEMLVSKCFVFILEEQFLKLRESKGILAESDEYKALQSKSFLKSLRSVLHPFLVDEKELNKNLQILQQLSLKVVVPMRIQDQVKGVLILGEKITRNPYTADELEFLSTLCNRAMISLENARLFEEALEKERMEEELNIARDIQQRLLPGSYPDIQGYELLGINIPSRQVGGDYFDCFQLEGNRLAIAIADVSGKGVPASLLMSNLQAMLRSLVTTHTDIGSMVGRINNMIYENTSYDKFITFFYAEINTIENTLTYVNAGHNPPYLYRIDGSQRTLDEGGLLLGMMPNVPYPTETLNLKEGDLVLMFTDGVSEAKNLKDEEFEEWRIEQMLACNRNSSVEHIINLIINEIRTFSQGTIQSDDVTMLAFRVLA